MQARFDHVLLTIVPSSELRVDCCVYKVSQLAVKADSDGVDCKGLENRVTFCSYVLRLQDTQFNDLTLLS